jgi:hypothetical protein
MVEAGEGLISKRVLGVRLPLKGRACFSLADIE